MAQIVQAGYAGNLQSNPLGVDAQSLYNAYDARRVEAKNDQIALAQKLDNEWNTTFMPAIANMMNSSDPNVRNAARQRYMQGVVAYANSRGRKLTDQDLQAILNEFDARYSNEGFTNLEKQYLADRNEAETYTGGTAPQGGTSGGGGGTAQGEGGGNPPPGGLRSDGKGASEDTSAPPFSSQKPYDPTARPNTLGNAAEVFAAGARQAASPIFGLRYGPAKDADAQRQASIDERKAKAEQDKYNQMFDAYMGNSTYSATYLDTLSNQAQAKGDTLTARAAKAAANAKRNQMRPQHGQMQNAVGGRILPREDSAPTMISTTEASEPELVIPQGDVEQYGAEGAVQRAMQNTKRGEDVDVRGGAGGNAPGMVQGSPQEFTPPEASPDVPPSPQPESAPPTALPEPLVKAQARTAKPVAALAKRAQDFLTAASSAKTPQEAKAQINRSYLAVDRIARVVSSTPEFKKMSADTMARWAAWARNATPEDLAGAGLKDVSDARTASLDRASRERIAYAQIQAQKDLAQMQFAMTNEETKRTMDQVLQAYYKSGIEDTVTKRYGGDISLARQKSPEVNHYYQLVEMFSGQKPTTYKPSGFLNLGRTQVPEDNSKNLMELAQGYNQLNGMVTRKKSYDWRKGEVVEQDGSGTGGAYSPALSKEQLDAIAAGIRSSSQGGSQR